MTGAAGRNRTVDLRITNPSLHRLLSITYALFCYAQHNSNTLEPSIATFTQRGDKQWQVQIRRRGYPSLTQTFKKKVDAVGWARQVESEMDRGVHVSSKEAEATTFGQCLQRYKVEITPHKKSGAKELYVIDRLLAHRLARYSMASIHGAEIAAVRDERMAAGLAAATVVRELALISHVFSVARIEWRMSSLVNPVEAIRKPKVDNARERRVLAASMRLGTQPMKRVSEIEALIDVAGSAELPAIVIVAIETAMRRSEIAALKHSNINVVARTAFIEDSKNGTSRTVPLSTAALNALRSNNVTPIDGRVFSMSPDAITRAFNRAKAKAREAYELQACERPPDPQGKHFLLDLTFHDLRHEATSRLATIFSMHELVKVTGHKDTKMLLRYYHPDMSELARKLA